MVAVVQDIASTAEFGDLLGSQVEETGEEILLNIAENQ